MANENGRKSASASEANKPKLALAIATAGGVGYIKKAPGTFGSLVGVATAFLSSVFFLQPASVRALFSLHPDYETVLRNELFPLPGANVYNAVLALPIFFAIGLFIVLGAIGVWSANKAASFAGIKDPQFVVIDEVAGQHLTLLLPLIPIALPHLTAHMDLSGFTIFFALSLVNWKYLLLGFILFRVFDIWKPWPVHKLEKLPGGWGIMADDWMAGLYAAILLRVALHFGLLTFYIGWV
jgi:phosphatidylglycerophosphatase A